MLARKNFQMERAFVIHTRDVSQVVNAVQTVVSKSTCLKTDTVLNVQGIKELQSIRGHACKILVLKIRFMTKTVIVSRVPG